MVNLGPEFWDPTYDQAERQVAEAKIKAAKDATPTCFGCRKEPQDIPEYAAQAAEEGESPSNYAKSDGTYSAEHNMFTCDECYIKMGAPLNRDLIPRYV